MKSAALLLTASLALAAGTASAATLCVNPLGTGGCSATIQAAVTAATGADIVLIGPGVYNENVTVLAGKDGLRVYGASKLATILDPSPNSDPAHPFAGTGVGLTINSNNVQVKNMTIRNGNSDAIDVLGNGTLIQLVRFIANRGYSIYVASGYTGTQILNNELRSMEGSSAIYTAGTNTNTLVKMNFFQTCDNGCVSISGDNVTVSYNKIYQSEDTAAIYVSGNNPIVGFNTVQTSDSYCIDIGGNNATVTNNRVSDCASGGINIAGSGATVSRNAVANVSGDGIYIYANTGAAGTASYNTVTFPDGYGVYIQGASPTASYNKVTHSTGDGIYAYGYDTVAATFSPVVAARNVVNGVLGDALYAYGAETTVDHNLFRDMYGYGMDAECTNCGSSSVAYNQVNNTFEDNYGIYTYSQGPGLVVQRNSVSRSMDYSYYISGTAAQTVTYNTATDQGGDSYEACFYITAPASTITYNTATRCSENGFNVTSSNNTLTNNLASSNYGNGFDINGSNNILTNNRSQLNAGAGFAVTAGTGNNLNGGNLGGGNRTDFCDDGTSTSQIGNLFTTTAPDCDINK